MVRTMARAGRACAATTAEGRRSVAHQVVCISRSRAAGGEAVGRMVSDALRFRYVDDEILVRAAEKADVDTQLVADAESRKSLLTRVIEVMATAGTVALDPAAAFAPDALVAVNASANYQQLIGEVIQETGAAGDAVIVAHAASITLAGMDGVLRVLVTASPEARAQRLVDAGGVSADDARRAIDESDAARADYFRRFYDISEELPTHYDLVVNTDVLSIDGAAQAVIAAARS